MLQFLLPLLLYINCCKTESMDLAVNTIIKKESIDKGASNKVCRLCLLEISNYQSIIGSVKYMLDLVVCLKLLISDYPIICHNCLVMLKQTYTFKTSCLDIEERIQAFGKMSKKEIVDLKQVVRMDNMNVKIDKEDVICRICLKPGKGNLYTKLGRYDEDPLKHMMDKCLPEMKTETVPQVLCPPCLEMLEEYFHFLMQCLATEEKINYYCEVKNVFSKVDLYNVYIFSITMEDNGLVYFNGDSEHSESPLSGFTIKCEQPDEVFSEYTPEPAPQATQVVTLQVTKDMDGDEIITDVHADASAEEEDSTHQNCITPMSEVLNVKYSEDPKVDEAKASMEMEEMREPETVPQSDESTEDDDSDLDPDYLSKHKKKNRCGMCSFSCDTKTGLKIHHTTMHQKVRDNSDKKKYKCAKFGCQFETAVSADFKSHMAQHETQAATMTCLTCEATFTKKKLFNQHVAGHKKSLSAQKLMSPRTKQRAFAINGQTFKMYRCQFCPYQTRRRNYLTKHMSVHKKTSELKTYKCENCSFETIQKENLFSHLQSHNSEKLAKKCFLCSFQPATEEALKAHVESVHKNKSNNCI